MGPRCEVCKKPVGRGGELLWNRPDGSSVWLCGRQACADKFNDEPTTTARAEVLEVTGGVPIVKKVRRAKWAAGQLWEESGSVWRVEHVRVAGIDVRAVAGREAGKESTWSVATAGLKPVTPEDLEQRKAKTAAARVVELDEHTCPNCWPGAEETGEERERLGRDPSCPAHQVADVEKAAKAQAAGCCKPRREESPEDVAKVLELRKAGKSYAAIEKAMGWPDQHGARAFKIVKREEKIK